METSGYSQLRDTFQPVVLVFRSKLTTPTGTAARGTKEHPIKSPWVNVIWAGHLSELGTCRKNAPGDRGEKKGSCCQSKIYWWSLICQEYWNSSDMFFFFKTVSPGLSNPQNTLCQKLVHTKNRVARPKQQSSVRKCQEDYCELYIGETKQLLTKRMAQQRRVTYQARILLSAYTCSEVAVVSRSGCAASWTGRNASENAVSR